MLKSSWPNIEPWGTADVILSHLLNLTRRTCCCLFVKWNERKCIFWKPYASHLKINRSPFIVLKTFDKSTGMGPNSVVCCYFFWILYAILITYLSRSSPWRCSVKRVFLEISQNSQKNICARVSFLIKLQAWPSGRLFLFFMELLIWIYMILSKTFPVGNYMFNVNSRNTRTRCDFTPCLYC